MDLVAIAIELDIGAMAMEVDIGDLAAIAMEISHRDENRLS